MKRTARQRILGAVLAALVLHALLLLALLRAPPPPPLKAVPRQAAMQVELIPKSAAVRTSGEAHQQPWSSGPAAQRNAEAPSAGARAPGVAATRDGGRTGASVMRGGAAEARDVAGSARTSGQADQPAPWSAEWQAAEGLERGLRLDLPAGAVGGGMSSAEAGMPVRQKSAQELLAEEKHDVSGRIDGWVGGIKAVQRAENPDPYWRAVRQALEHGFDPGWDVLDKGPETSSGTLNALVENYKKAAAAYGKSGNPFGDEQRDTLNNEIFSLANEERGLGSRSLEGVPQFGLSVGMGMNLQALSGKAFTHKLVVLIRITQRDDGSIFAVQIDRPSGNKAYDDLAVSQAKRLKLGQPQQGKVTLWAFETDFIQVPPMPIVGCQLDDFVPKNCWYPLQKRTHSRIHLEAIY